MLKKMKDLKGYTIHGREEDLGKVEDFYFDKERFIIRYVVVDTGNWLQEKLTLISPKVFKEINHESEEIFVNINSKELEEGPGIEKSETVSKEMEEKLVNHYEWPTYWGAAGAAGAGAGVPAGRVGRGKIFDYEESLEKQKSPEKQKQTGKKDAESNLRSFNEVRKYHIQAEDDEFGHLEDLLFDEENWVIRYLLVDTRNFLPGKDVLIALEWLQSISWDQEKIYVNKTKDEIKSSPEYEEDKYEQVVDRDYEEKLYDHYNETKYWQ